MDKLTITEALSEINLIKKKIKAKQDRITSALFRVEHMPDPFASEGGSVEMVARESQSLNDLYRRFARIRGAISQANLVNEISLGEDTRTIHDWLVWKREIATDQISFTATVQKTTKSHMDGLGKSPQVYKDANDQVQIVKYAYNVDYAIWLRKHEILNEKLEQLDGKLSLKNATIVIEI